MNSAWRVMFFASAFMPAVSTFAGELLIGVSVAPTGVGVVAPQARISSQDVAIEKIASGHWRYSLLNSKRVYGTLSLDLEQPPQGYELKNLQIIVPFEVDEPISVNLVAVQMAPDRDDIREIADIHNTDVVRNIDLPSLFQVYQRAALLSKRRVTAIETTGRPLYVKDVQLFFKLLESARQLGWEANLVPSDIVLQVKNFLRKRLTDARDREVIEKSIQRGVDDVSLLLNQIESIQAEQLKKIWQQIQRKDTAERGSATACERYSAFRETLLRDTDKLLRESWEKKYHFTKLVSEIVSLCATRRAAEEIAARGRLDSSAVEKIVEDFGPVLPASVAAPPNSATARALQKHNNVLRNLGLQF